MRRTKARTAAASSSAMPTTCTPLRALFPGEGLQRGHLRHAGAAPAGPEVDQDRAAGVVRREIDLAAVDPEREAARSGRVRRVSRQPRRPSGTGGAEACIAESNARWPTSVRHSGPGPGGQQAGDDAERPRSERDEHDLRRWRSRRGAALRAFDELVRLFESRSAAARGAPARRGRTATSADR